MSNVDGLASNGEAPPWLVGDPLARLTSYRLALGVTRHAQSDATSLARHAVTRDIASQLVRAVGSIGANIAEGYSRGSGRDRVRFYEYALGSAREALHWYETASLVLGAEVVKSRSGPLVRIRSLLLVTIPRERPRHLDG